MYMHEWGTMDMNAVLDHLVATKGFTGIIWIGHSIGGQLVGLLENKEHISKVISINAAFGYWRYFPYPMKAVIWFLWYVVGPLLTKIYGYGVMKKIGWGARISRRMYCVSGDRGAPIKRISWTSLKTKFMRIDSTILQFQ